MNLVYQIWCMSFSMSSIVASYEPNQRCDTFLKGLRELRNLFEKLKLCMSFSMSSIVASYEPNQLGCYLLVPMVPGEVLRQC